MQDVSGFQMPQQPTTTRLGAQVDGARLGGSQRAAVCQGHQEPNRDRAEHTLTALADAFLLAVHAPHTTWPACFRLGILSVRSYGAGLGPIRRHSSDAGEIDILECDDKAHRPR
jgi:hypothetical protein